MSYVAEMLWLSCSSRVTVIGYILLWPEKKAALRYASEPDQERGAASQRPAQRAAGCSRRLALLLVAIARRQRRHAPSQQNGDLSRRSGSMAPRRQDQSPGRGEGGRGNSRPAPKTTPRVVSFAATESVVKSPTKQRGPSGRIERVQLQRGPASGSGILVTPQRYSGHRCSTWLG